MYNLTLCKLYASQISSPSVQLVFKMSNKQRFCFCIIAVIGNSFSALFKNKLFFSHQSIDAGGQFFLKHSF